LGGDFGEFIAYNISVREDSGGVSYWNKRMLRQGGKGGKEGRERKKEKE